MACHMQAFTHAQLLLPPMRVLPRCVHTGCRIIGLEIVEGARPVHEHPFSGPTAFMLGNEVRVPPVQQARITGRRKVCAPQARGLGQTLNRTGYCHCAAAAHAFNLC